MTRRGSIVRAEPEMMYETFSRRCQMLRKTGKGSRASRRLRIEWNSSIATMTPLPTAAARESGKPMHWGRRWCDSAVGSPG